MIEQPDIQEKPSIISNGIVVYVDSQTFRFTPTNQVPVHGINQSAQINICVKTHSVSACFNEILFDQFGSTLLPYSLSSGEKQLLVIMMTTLVQDMNPCVLLMDEPEISLHIEWQQQLIQRVRSLNPNVQIIMTTHSPALIMDGWMDAVTDVEDITVK